VSIVAQKVQVILVDDLDGGSADETVTFSLDGVSYEIDLSKKNASAFAEALAPFVAHARRVGMPGPRLSSRSSKRPTGAHDPVEVRVWANANGYTLSDRGRIRKEILAAFENAQGRR
jgi:hypothetical protein